MRRTLLYLGLASLMLYLMGGAVPAAADTPERMSIPFSMSGTDRATCGFPIRWAATGTWEVTAFVDGDGSWRASITQWKGTEVDVNRKTGTTITGTWREINLETSESIVVVGAVYSYPVPGQGNVLVQAGRFVLDLGSGEWIFTVGRDDWASGDVAAWCAALV